MTKLFQIIIISIPVVLLAIVGFVFLDLDGENVVVWKTGQQSAFIHGLRPSGRVLSEQKDENGNKFARLNGDPIYLSVTPPGNYDSVDIDVSLNAGNQPVVEIGATVNADAGQIILKPMVHQTIDNLKWETQRRANLVFMQRENVYKDIDQFLSDPPSLSEIATYNYDLPEDNMLPREWLRGKPVQQEEVSLRGFHEFVTATDGRKFEMEVMYMDMNRAIGEDPVAIRVYQNGKVVGEVKAKDDGVNTATNASLERKFLRVEAEGLQSGTLKVELNAGNDIYWRIVNTNLPKLTYSSNVHVGDEVGYLDGEREVRLWTDAQHLTLFTRHAEGVQKVKVGKNEVDIAIPHERYNIENENVGITEIVIPRGDLLVVTDGRIAFSKSAFFNPFPTKLDDRTDLDKLGINYLVAEYPKAKRKDGLTVASASFSLANLEREGSGNTAGESELDSGSYRFVFSLPRVSDRDEFIDIYNIKMTFRRPRRSLKDVLDLVLKKIF